MKKHGDCNVSLDACRACTTARHAALFARLFLSVVSRWKCVLLRDVFCELQKGDRSHIRTARWENISQHDPPSSVQLDPPRTRAPPWYSDLLCWVSCVHNNFFVREERVGCRLAGFLVFGQVGALHVVDQRCHGPLQPFHFFVFPQRKNRSRKHRGQSFVFLFSVVCRVRSTLVQVGMRRIPPHSTNSPSPVLISC